eukprot:GHVT01086829.1.p1 GENE.GHVT01086829.1~~GHVT01086829.1.p1  ORF type:complete len:320 (+),score=37.99 GHVT01086829.1:407-1366(+)
MCRRTAAARLLRGVCGNSGPPLAARGGGLSGRRVCTNFLGSYASQTSVPRSALTQLRPLTTVTCGTHILPWGAAACATPRLPISTDARPIHSLRGAAADETSAGSGVATGTGTTETSQTSGGSVSGIEEGASEDATGSGMASASGHETEACGAPVNPQAAAESADKTVQSLQEEVAQLREASAFAKTENKEIRDKLLRALADQENTRQRYERELANSRQYAVTNFAKGMLLVADNLALAMDHVDSEQLEKNEELKQFFDGVKLTDGCLQKELDKFGIKKYDPIGHPFDPNLHEALFEMTDPTKVSQGKTGQDYPSLMIP